jgi:anti-sigma B factor antagonist
MAVMGFDYHITGDKAQIILTGEIDLQVTGELKLQIDQLRQITHLDIEASHVSYMDSSGVAVLLYARQAAISGGFQFTISSMSRSVFRILEVARLDAVLPIGQVVNSADSSTDAFGLTLSSPPEKPRMPDVIPDPPIQPSISPSLDENSLADDVEAAISADLASDEHITDHNAPDDNISPDHMSSGDFKPGSFS